jgi:hypothetical protein
MGLSRPLIGLLYLTLLDTVGRLVYLNRSDVYSGICPSFDAFNIRF